MDNPITHMQVYVDVLPVGSVILWHPPTKDAPLPTGWALCDGSAYSYLGTTYRTPNLIDRFVQGCRPEALGKDGGASSYRLEIAHLPRHHHSVQLTSSVPSPAAPFPEVSEKVPESTTTKRAEWDQYKLMAPTTYTASVKGQDDGRTVYDRGAQPDNNAEPKALGDFLPALVDTLEKRQNEDRQHLSQLVKATKEVHQHVQGLGVKEEETGDNKPLSLLPPYLSLCYIMKVA
jgi:microcystin-dependent protein